MDSAEKINPSKKKSDRAKGMKVVIALIIVVYLVLFPSLFTYIHREVYYYQQIHAYEELAKRYLYKQYGDYFEITGYEIEYNNNSSYALINVGFDYIQSIKFNVVLLPIRQETTFTIGQDSEYIRKEVNK